MSAFQSTFDSLRGFPRPPVRRRPRGAAHRQSGRGRHAGGAEPGAQPVYHRGQPVSGDRLFLSGRRNVRVPVRPVAGRANGHRHRRGGLLFAAQRRLFSPGFTLNEFLLGFLYGCWLYKKPVSLWRTFCACLSAVLVINLVLTPLWLNIMYGNAFVISGMRLIKNAVKLPLDTALLYFLLKAVETHRKKAL